MLTRPCREVGLLALAAVLRAVVGLLLEPPRLLGVEAMTADGLRVNALLITEAGRQGEDRRELLARMAQRLATHQ